MGVVRGDLGTSRETQGVPRAGLWPRPPTFARGQLSMCPSRAHSFPPVLFTTIFSSEENRGLHVLRSSKQPVCPQIKLLFGAFLHNHRSGTESTGQ